MGNIVRPSKRPRSAEVFYEAYISHIDRSRGQYPIYHDSFAITPKFEPLGAIVTFLV